MTKVELVNRIMEVTASLGDGRGGRAALLDCVDGFAETLLLRIRNRADMALEKVITDAMGELRAQGRGRQESDCPTCDDEVNRRRERP